MLSEKREKGCERKALRANEMSGLIGNHCPDKWMGSIKIARWFLFWVCVCVDHEKRREDKRNVCYAVIERVRKSGFEPKT